MWLSLVAREQLAADTGQRSEGTGFNGFTLAHNVHSPKEVDKVLASIEQNGGRIVKKAEAVDGGTYSGFIADPDGFIWEISFNPHYPHT